MPHRGPVGVRYHYRRDGRLIGRPILPHGNWVTENVVGHDYSNGSCRLGVTYFCAESARATGDQGNRTGEVLRNRCATASGRGCCVGSCDGRDEIGELTHCGTERAGADSDWNTEGVRIRARSRGDDLLRLPGDWIVPAPGPLFPAAMATTRPASTAWLTAFSSGSFFLTT